MTKITRPNCRGRRLRAAVAGLMFVICPLASLASAADEGAGGLPPQAPSESDSLQYYQDLMQRAAQRAEKEDAAAGDEGQALRPLRKDRSPTSGMDSGPIRVAGPSADIIENQAGGYEVVSKEESPQESSRSANQAKSTIAEPEYSPFPTSDEINEMDREARKFTLSGFLKFLVIAAVVFMVAYVLPAVVWGRKSAASKVRIEELGDWQETASLTPKEPDNP